jgi:hypothetical protein
MHVHLNFMFTGVLPNILFAPRSTVCALRKLRTMFTVRKIVSQSAAHSSNIHLHRAVPLRERADLPARTAGS